MPAQIIDGKVVSARVRDEVKALAERYTPLLKRQPGLAVILVGDNPASEVYVASKTKAAHSCGIRTFDHKLPNNATQDELHAIIEQLNANPEVDGILLQLPLPKGLDEFQAIVRIAPEKDADGLHPFNQGLLMRGADCFQPCTPKGSMTLIREARAMMGRSPDISGLHAVVVGRSILVGRPMALLLLQANCTVEICHSRTLNLWEECRSADILVAAIGKPNFIGPDAIKPGAIVIDVGINRVEGKKGKGSLVGDVDFDGALERAGAITPVPGGVGPMTIAMLLSNTVESARRKLPKD